VFDRDAYRGRSVVEACLNRLKHWRGHRHPLRRTRANYRAVHRQHYPGGPQHQSGPSLRDVGDTIYDLAGSERGVPPVLPQQDA